jgi:release factor glutamine methyltransferase
LNKETQNRLFHYNELTIKLHPEVYEPAEDTFLLLEALVVKKGDTVLEIGTGCGLIALECAYNGASVVCTDINPYAVKSTKSNYSINKKLIKGRIEIRKGDLFSPIKDNEIFDVIVFNPPYLPTKKGELIGGSGWFDIATNGGSDGLKHTKKYLDKLNFYLKECGCAYFIFSSLSDRKALENYINKNNFDFNIVSSTRFNDEVLTVYKIKKKKD